mmetsp:Transcript_47647/g.120736  ORF Transcript_47647/g.120736 Transcript_47647/m.120736 type:complete len:237 (-) Transcript_47647:200-910(-)
MGERTTGVVPRVGSCSCLGPSGVGPPLGIGKRHAEKGARDAESIGPLEQPGAGEGGGLGAAPKFCRRPGRGPAECGDGVEGRRLQLDVGDPWPRSCQRLSRGPGAGTGGDRRRRGGGRAVAELRRGRAYSGPGRGDRGAALRAGPGAAAPGRGLLRAARHRRRRRRLRHAEWQLFRRGLRRRRHAGHDAAVRCGLRGDHAEIRRGRPPSELHRRYGPRHPPHHRLGHGFRGESPHV